jgi:hypothetical protein
MHLRQLTTQLVHYLDGKNEHNQVRWPKYRSLATYARRKRWAFSEREYSRLRRVHVGAESLVNVLVAYLYDMARSELIQAFPGIATMDATQALDNLTVFHDGSALRRHDYIRGTTWREHVLVHALCDDDAEQDSFCHDQEIVEQLARAQFLEAGGQCVLRRHRNRQEAVLSAAEERIGVPLEDFLELIVCFWRALPECVWLTSRRGRYLGGSIALPLTNEVYEKITIGQLSPQELQPDIHLESPGRNLWILAMTTFPEVPRPRLPGVHTARQIRKLCQHVAVLIGKGASQLTPVRFFSAAGSPEIEGALLRLGNVPLNRCLKGGRCSLFEMVIPPPERTIADFSTAANSSATLIGTAWRLLRGEQSPVRHVHK